MTYSCELVSRNSAINRQYQEVMNFFNSGKLSDKDCTSHPFFLKGSPPIEPHVGFNTAKVNGILGLYYFNPTGISTNPENFSWKREEEKEVFLTYKQKYDKSKVLSFSLSILPESIEVKQNKKNSNYTKK